MSKDKHATIRKTWKRKLAEVVRRMDAEGERHAERLKPLQSERDFIVKQIEALGPEPSEKEVIGLGEVEPISNAPPSQRPYQP